MKVSKLTAMLCFIGIWNISNAQKNTINDSTIIDFSQHHITNDTVLAPLRTAFKELKDSAKVINIVHIGDSHVQGAIFPHAIRTALQNTYGNAGRGFIFPYRVAGTNGDGQVQFTSTNTWRNMRNVKSDGSDNIAFSGILLETTDPNFQLSLNLDSSLMNYQQVQILSPNPQAFYASAFKSEQQSTKAKTTKDNYKNVVYKVKSGDNLSLIAQKNGTTVSTIKSWNSLRNAHIKVGQSLIVQRKKIPDLEIAAEPAAAIEKPQELLKNSAGDYEITSATSKIYFTAASKEDHYQVDGFVLKNEQPGIRYHATGVNGAQFKDYTMFPRFFEQLAALKPDLIIVSLGTNESFSQTLTAEQFTAMLQEFNAQLKTNNIMVPVIATSPPPSFKNRKVVNTIATTFSDVLKINSTYLGWAFYDLHRVLGTSTNMRFLSKRKLTASDLIHYNKDGYMLMGDLIADALIKTLSH